jgi:predicted transcriptional regulator
MPRPTPRKRRARHDIIMEILEAAKKGTKKTHIMYKAKLSFDMIEKYLSALKEADFITEESGVWKTTEKGLHVIKACEICQRLIKEAT